MCFKLTGSAVVMIVTLLFVPRAPAARFFGSDLSAERRLQQSDLEYVGAFRVPAGQFGQSLGFGFGGSPVAYDPANNSLFIGGHPNEMSIAEVSIPTPVKSSEISRLPTAAVLQALADPTDGGAAGLLRPGNMVNLGGLLVYRGRLYGTAYVYYDADGAQRVSHYSRSLKLRPADATPLYSVWNPEQTGFLSGYLSAIPAEWQAILGGRAITGQCCIPIVSRTSYGPSAFAWNPEDLGVKKPVPATPLQYYSAEHPTLGAWEGSNSVWGGTTQMGGVAVIAGTRTALFIGANGTGEFCYGPATSNRALAGKPVPGSADQYCYDPMGGDVGQHAYPYNYQFWAYDLNDWAAVKARRKEPWEVKPYGVWPFELATAGAFVIGGVGYDDRRQLLYLSQLQADSEAYRPLIHAFHIR